MARHFPTLYPGYFLEESTLVDRGHVILLLLPRFWAINNLQTIYHCIVPVFLAWNQRLLITVQTCRYVILPFQPSLKINCFIAQNLGNKAKPRDHDPPGYFRSKKYPGYEVGHFHTMNFSLGRTQFFVSVYRFFVNESKIATTNVQEHLQIRTCEKSNKYCIEVKHYDNIVNELKDLGKRPGAKIWVCTINLSHAMRRWLRNW